MRGYDYVRTITENMVKLKLPERRDDAHKGDFGKLMCVCGSKNMPGAAKFCISAALRCGVGLVQAVIPESIYSSVSSKISECTYIICKDDHDGFILNNSSDAIFENLKKCTAVTIGCGMGWNENTKSLVYNLVRNSPVPIVIDADGINVISENIDILKEAKSKIILTPHLGEAARLFGVSTDPIKLDKIKYARKLADDYGVTVALKGHRTAVADETGEVFLNQTGNSGMAKGGSGDVLTGMIGSFLAQGLSPIDAAICGVYIHGESGDICKEKYSSASMLPSNIVENIPKVFKNFEIGET